MLKIRAEHLEEIRALALNAHPVESCGIIAAPEGEDLPGRVVPMVNAAQSETFFQFDAREQLKVWRELDSKGEVPLVIFHSHTHSQAVPSPTDIEHAAEPDAHYLIIATDVAVAESTRSFRIFNGRVVEENIKVIR